MKTKLYPYRFRLIGDRETPDYDTVDAPSIGHAIWEMTGRHGAGIMLYRVNVENNGLYFRPAYAGNA